LVRNFAPLLFRQAADLFQNLCCAHDTNLPRRLARARRDLRPPYPPSFAAPGRVNHPEIP
jgi:hypothetical protein